MNIRKTFYDNTPRIAMALTIALVYYVNGPQGAVAVLCLSLIFSTSYRLFKTIFDWWSKRNTKQINDLCEVEPTES